MVYLIKKQWERRMEQIRFVLERFYYGWKMNVLVFDREDHFLDCCMGTIEKIDGDDGEIREKIEGFEQNEIYLLLKQRAEKAGKPVLHMEEDGVYYMAFLDGEKRFFLFGPIAAEELTFSQQIQFRRNHGIDSRKYMVPRVALSAALNGVSLFYYIMTGKQVTEKEILKESGLETGKALDFSEKVIYEVKNATEEKKHLAYREESEWAARIENGTLEEQKDVMTPENLEKLDEIGTLSGNGSKKQFEYLAVTSTVLACRAAIRGGMDAYEAYKLSELFLQRISRCTDVMEFLEIHTQAALEFSRQVRLSRENRGHDCVEQCKDYIARHRNRKFSLEEVAKAVGKNGSYLSRTFSEQTGMTMQEYALRIRLEAAANILQYSNAGIGEIAEYLHFPSQSYFGERFKKRYGETPAEYRKHHKIRDFKE